MPRKRGLSASKRRIDLSVNASNQHQSNVRQLTPNSGRSETKGCKGNTQICGKEAACRSFPNNTSKCVCPHDLSPPTSDLTCPNRLVVPFTPHPIPNIIPPSGNNSTNNTSTLPEAEQVEGLKYKFETPEIVGVSVAFVAIIVLISSIIYCVRKRSYSIKSQRSPLDGAPINLKKGLLSHKYTSNPQYFTTTSGVLTIQRESIIFLHVIGEGCFGKVYKGEWHNDDTKETVAIKVLKIIDTPETEQDFMREVDIMSTFAHPNLLSLKGMVHRDPTNNPWMVFEYMPYGDLAEVLRANSSQFRSSKPGLQPLTKDSLHWISIQIASGMTYLSVQRFVHRDLACRNCLVGSGLTVKIADFGMSRDIYTCDYYKIGEGSRMLPVRWMSMESVLYGRFTLETDVWSFGVVLWEVYTFGKQPYYGFSNEEVVKLILQKTRLIPPDECPPIICQIMCDCWKIDPRERIKFPDILERLEKAQNELTQQGTLPRPPQGPVLLRTPDVMDPDGYLLPAPAIRHDYLQALPALSN